MENFIRLNKFIASNGVSSRRKVDELIEQERVTVNGATIKELGFKIDPAKDKIAVDGEAIRADKKKIYVMLNKPKGIITSVSDDKHRATVIDLIKINQKIFPVGRLDYHTSGLLLLTNDGELANKLMSPKSKVYKTYFVQLSKPLEEKHKIKLSEGIKLEGVRTAPAIIKYPKKTDYQSLYISIYEGKNHQVRNMFEHYGYFVRELQRTEYAGLKLGSLREGEWSYLTPEELTMLNSIVKDTQANYPKPAHTGKRSFRKVNKYNSRGDREDVKRGFKKFDKRDGTTDKKLSFNKKRDEERGVELGFRKNDDAELKNDFKKYDKSEDKREFKRDFKKFDSRDGKKNDNLGFKKFDKRDDRRDDRRDDKKDVRRDFKKFDPRDNTKGFKPGFKKFDNRDDKRGDKQDDKKDVRRDFKKFDARDSKKGFKPGFKKFDNRDDKRDVKRDFKKDGKFGRRNDKADVKKDFKKFDTVDDKKDFKLDFKKYDKRDDRKDVKGGFKKFDARGNKKDVKRNFKKYDRRDEKKDVKPVFKKFDRKDERTRKSFKDK